jgi:ribosome-associated toxin RatA of RatAB toxin-antitoxin module
VSLLLGTALSLYSLVVRSAELRDITVDLRNDRYRLTSETYLDVSRESLYAILSDFEQFEKFTSAIVESRNTGPDERGRPGFYARMQGCVLLFCKSFIRTGYVLLSPIAEIVAISNPDESDFKFSRERWQLIPDGDGTIMIYDFELEPAFWVPPVIGPFVIQRVLRSGAERAVNRIEALAYSEELRSKAKKPVHSE